MERWNLWAIEAVGGDNLGQLVSREAGVGTLATGWVCNRLSITWMTDITLIRLGSIRPAAQDQRKEFGYSQALIR